LNQIRQYLVSAVTESPPVHDEVLEHLRYGRLANASGAMQHDLFAGSQVVSETKE
jgi:hypothetical protein